MKLNAPPQKKFANAEGLFLAAGKKSSADAEFPALAEWTAIQLNVEGTAQPVRQRIEQTRRMRQIDVYHLPTSLM